MSFGVGNVLATTVRLWFRNLPRFLLLTVICYVPIIGFDLVLQNDAVMDLMSRHIYGPLMKVHPQVGFEVASGSWIPLSALAAAIALCTVGQLRDDRISIWGALASTLRRLPWIVGVALVLRLVTWGVVAVITVVRWNPRDYMETVGSLTEHVLLELLWLVLASLFIAALPAAVVERRGVFGAVVRGFLLARGERMRVFAIKLVHHVLLSALYLGLNRLIVPTDLGSMEAYQQRLFLYAYVRFGAGLLFASLAAVLAAVIYERLRASKEGATPNQLQTVFD